MNKAAIIKELRKNTTTDSELQVLNYIDDPLSLQGQAIHRVIQMIADDGYDITGFALHEVLEDGSGDDGWFSFCNYATKQAFDVIVNDAGEWSFYYTAEWVGDANCFPTQTIAEAVSKYKWE